VLCIKVCRLHSWNRPVEALIRTAVGSPSHCIGKPSILTPMPGRDYQNHRGDQVGTRGDEVVCVGEVGERENIKGFKVP
jgi:hypothetical protein